MHCAKYYVIPNRMSKYNGIDNASLLHPLWLVSWVSSVSQSPVSAPSRCLRAAAELGTGEPRATATTITASTFLCSLHQTDNSSADTQSRARPLSFVAGIEEEYLIHTMDYQEKNYMPSHLSPDFLCTVIVGMLATAGDW